MSALLISALAVSAPTAQAEVGGAPFNDEEPPGQLVEDASRLSLGQETACIVLDNGNARCWGENNVGQAGTGYQDFLSDDATPLDIGDDETPDTYPTVDVGGLRVLEIASGPLHTCASLVGGTMRCWGAQTNGPTLGVPESGGGRIGDNEPPTDIPPVSLGGSPSAIAVGERHSCAILTDLSVRCWGEARFGALGYGLGGEREDNIGDDETPASVGPVPIGGDGRAWKISAGRYSTCVIMFNGDVRCWGQANAIAGTSDRIGDDEPASATPVLTPAASFGGGTPVAISSGNQASCVITDKDEVWCWGAGRAARLSSGNNTAPTAAPAKVELGGRIPVALDLGFEHACVLFQGGGVGCWGDGGEGRLGYGGTEDIGDDEAALSGGLLDLGAGRTAKAISAGRRGTCALLDNDTLRCWGDGSQGVPGGATTIDITAPTDAPPINFVGTATFRPLSPFRILETRSGQPGPGPIQGKGIVNPGGQIDVQITGQGGIPSNGVYAVVLNLTLAQAIDRGFVTAFPFGTARPNASNVNVTGAGQTAPNKVIVPVSQDGKISIFTRGGGHLIADVFGYFEATASANAGRLIGVNPARVVDTRPGFDPAGQKGKLGPGGEIEVKVTGANGVPGTGVSAVVLNVTGADANRRGFITVYPGNVNRPTTSNINLAGPGATRPNTVIVPVSPTGTIKIFSQNGAHIVVDITAYFTDATGENTDDGLFARINPARLGDSRDTSGGPLPKGGTVTFEVEGKLGIPSTANAGVFNLTATDSRDRGFVTGYPSDIPRPDTSNLNLPGPNETIANLAVLPLGDSGDITLFTQNGASLIMDTAGYFL
ncbi:MAG: hypothetical protein AAGA42_20045 [Actinomycetota bacterium]